MKKTPKDNGVNGLPVNTECERLILGGLLLNPEHIATARSYLDKDDFALEKHRRIYQRSLEIADRGDHVDRITLANELIRYNELDSCDGITYLVSLDEGLPQVSSIQSYLAIVKEKAVLRRAIFTAQGVMNECVMGDQPAHTILLRAIEKLGELDASVAAKAQENLTVEEVVAAHDGGVQDLLMPTKNPGIPTGFARLDRYTTGLHKGNVYIIAARSSMGKSSLACNIAANLCEREIPGLILSMEMPSDSVLRRMTCGRAQVNHTAMLRGGLGIEERRRAMKAFSEIASWPLLLDDANSLTITGAFGKITRAIKKHGIQFVVVDYLQRMSWISDKIFQFKGNEYAAISTYSTMFKNYAMGLKLPILLLSQMSRPGKQKPGTPKRPSMEDLRGCLTADTKVFMGSGDYKAIPLIKAGDSIIAINSNQQAVPATVERCWSIGVRPVLQIKTSSGRVLRCTGNHPILTHEGFREASRLRIGQHTIACPFRVRIPATEISKSQRSRCRLVGYLVGNGSYIKHRSISFVTADSMVLDDFSSIVRREFPAITLRVENKGNFYEVDLVQVYANGYGKPGGNSLLNWLTEIGIHGQMHHNKIIPTYVHALGYWGAVEFLSGYLLTDGCIKGSQAKNEVKVHFDTVSVSLAQDVQALLTKLGISSVVQNPTRKKAAGNIQPIYRIEVSQNRENIHHLLRQLVLTGVKSVRAQAALALTAHHTSPGIFSLPRFLSDYLFWASHEDWQPQNKKMRRDTARHWGEFLGDQTLLMWANSDLLWEEIVSIEQDSEEEVWDLTIPSEANFIANGIVVHNSGRLEEDADVILSPYQEWRDNRDRDDLRGRAELIILKQRNGAVGTIPMLFKGSQFRFTEDHSLPDPDQEE